LCKYNPEYIRHGICIDNANLQKLPSDNVPSDLREFEDSSSSTSTCDVGPEIISEENSVTDCDYDEDDYEAFVERDDDGPLQVDRIRNTINFPIADSKAINEFKFDAICSLLFPKLFPTGKADPTKKGFILFILIIINKELIIRLK
jgi:hypothetical protein